MELKVEVKKDLHNSIAITDYTLGLDGGYIDVDGEYDRASYKNQYSFSESCTIDVLYRLTSTESILINEFYNTHDDCYLESFILPMESDGYYTIHHIVLPTQDWLNIVKEQGTYLADNYEFVYYINTIERRIYLYFPNLDDLSIATSEQVIDLTNVQNTTISCANFSIFCAHALEQCYINASKEVFASLNRRCSTVDSTAKFNRDFIWMTLNVINYLLEDERYTEAELILEELSCYNFCNTGNVDTSKRSGCGCHH